jgi:hypothetical protein
MPKTALYAEAKLPEPIGKPQHFTLSGERYVAVRFAEGKGPDYRKTAAIARLWGGEALTTDDPRGIGPALLKPGEWCFIINKNPDERAMVAVLDSKGYVSYDVYDYVEPNGAAPVVILKETGSSTKPQRHGHVLRGSDHSPQYGHLRN